MPRFDGTGPHGQGNIGGRRSGRGEFCTNGGRQRQGNGYQGRLGSFRLVGANQDQGFVSSCIERLQLEIQSLQARLADLKAQADK